MVKSTISQDYHPATFKQGDLISIGDKNQAILMVTTGETGIVLWASLSTGLKVGECLSLSKCTDLKLWRGRLILEN